MEDGVIVASSLEPGLVGIGWDAFRIREDIVQVNPEVKCDRCHDTGWTDATDIYPDGSYATGRRCPRGCEERQ